MKFLANNQRLLITTVIFWNMIFLYAIIFNNFTGWWLLFFITSVLLVLIVSLLFPLKHIHGQLLQKSPSYQVKQATTLKIMFTSKKRYLLPVFHFTIRLQTSEYLVDLFWIKKQINLPWLPENRGVFPTLPLIIESSDFLHLFTKQHSLELSGPFMIYPVVQKEIVTTLLHHLSFEKSSYYNALGSQTFEVKNFREYQSGDPLHAIDWKQSSKTNQLIIKEFHSEEATSWVLIFYGISHIHFEMMLSIYYSVFLELKTRLSFQQYILADIPKDCLEDEKFARLIPLKTEPSLPNIKKKKILLFSPVQTPNLKKQIASLSQTNDVFLLTIEKKSLYIFQNNQSFLIEKEVHNDEK